MNITYKLLTALIVLFLFSYLAIGIQQIDQAGARQFIIVALISNILVGLLGKTIATVLTIIVGLTISLYALWSKNATSKNRASIKDFHL